MSTALVMRVEESGSTLETSQYVLRCIHMGVYKIMMHGLHAFRKLRKLHLYEIESSFLNKFLHINSLVLSY